jgi:uncharacterized protein (DUF1810 family)
MVEIWAWRAVGGWKQSSSSGLRKFLRPRNLMRPEEVRRRMMTQRDSEARPDPFDLGRFVDAQEDVFATALAELRNGQKRTHWMWFVFPQIDGLGSSVMAKRYAIRNIEEARAYLNHPILGLRLVECAESVLAVEGRSVGEIFGYPDDLKLKSSMTLFASITQPGSVFVNILDKYFCGVGDVRTLELLVAEG